MQENVFRGLGHRRGAQRNADRHELRRLNIVVVVDAVPQHEIAGRGGQLVLRIQFEHAVAGVILPSVPAGDNEESVALDGHVRRIGTDLDRALIEIRGDGGDHRAHADLPGIGAAVVGGRRGTQTLRLQELRGERRRRGLEADGVRIGDIIAVHVDHRFGRRHPGQGRIHCRGQTHDSSPSMVDFSGDARKPGIEQVEMPPFRPPFQSFLPALFPNFLFAGIDIGYILELNGIVADVQRHRTLVERHFVNDPRDFRALIVQARDGLVHHDIGGDHILLELQRGQGVAQFIVRGNGLDLADLLENLAVVHRTRRILVLHFGDQERDELLQVHVVESIGIGDGAGSLLSVLALHAADGGC